MTDNAVAAGDDISTRRLFERELSLFFRQVVSVLRGYPRLIPHYLGTIVHQLKALRLREKNLRRGVSVPPVLIFSITGKCNLRCSGCYARVNQEQHKKELGADVFTRVLSDASGLGTRIVFLVGGEPLLRKDLIRIAAGFRKTEFLLFTNGTLFDEEMVGILRTNKNLFPMISMEGNDGATDSRRGEGVFARIAKATALLHKSRMPFGVSITVTSENIDQVTEPAFVDDLVGKGCRFFIYVSYIPVTEGSESLVLTQEQYGRLDTALESFRKSVRALFVSFPGDEERFGGCLSAGRGFIHVNAAGGVEPCPFAPFSDASITTGSFEDALRSDLFRVIRENRDKIEEHGGACALFEHRDWVRSLVADTGRKTGNATVSSPHS